MWLIKTIITTFKRNWIRLMNMCREWDIWNQVKIVRSILQSYRKWYKWCGMKGGKWYRKIRLVVKSWNRLIVRLNRWRIIKWHMISWIKWRGINSINSNEVMIVMVHSNRGSKYSIVILPN